ncbi:hypothetical protein ACFQX6_31150 [Streptosporangium lutulentum]
MASEQLENTRQALREAMAHAERAAELARLLDEAQARTADAERAADELRAVRERLSETEERLTAANATEEKLRKDLAEQRYQAEVAKWKLSSVQLARWSRIGDAIKTGKSNPVRLARGLRGAARPAKRPVAPERQPVPRKSGDKPPPGCPSRPRPRSGSSAESRSSSSPSASRPDRTPART